MWQVSLIDKTGLGEKSHTWREKFKEKNHGIIQTKLTPVIIDMKKKKTPGRSKVRIWRQ